MLFGNPTKSSAEADAKAGIPLEQGRDIHVIQRHGTVRPPQSAPDPRVRQAEEQVMLRPVLEEMESDRQATDVSVPPWSPFVGPAVMAALAVEFLAAWDLTAAMDLIFVTHLALSLSAAAGVFAATAAAAHYTSDLQRPEGARSKFMGVVVLALYSVLVIAAVIVRWNGLAMDESMDPAGEAAMSVLLAICAIAPAWLAKWLVPLWFSTRNLARLREHARQRYARAAKDVAAAERFLATVHDKPHQDDDARQRTAAEYEAHYRRKAAELNRKK